MRSVLMGLVFLGLTACTTMHGVESPPQQERLTGLAAPGQINITKAKTLQGVSKQKLAIVKSVNVDPQLKSFDQVRQQMGSVIPAYINDQKGVTKTAEVVFSDQLYLQALISPLKARFGSIVLAQDLADAFEQGADYVAIIDVRFEFVDLASKLVPGPIHIKHVANASVLFVNKKLAGGPDVVIENTLIQQHSPMGPEANVRQILKSVQEVRLKTLQEYETAVSQVLQ